MQRIRHPLPFARSTCFGGGFRLPLFFLGLVVGSDQGESVGGWSAPTSPTNTSSTWRVAVWRQRHAPPKMLATLEKILGPVFVVADLSCRLLCPQVYGSDLCLPAIEDARKNAQANGIDNCEFVCGKVGPPTLASEFSQKYGVQQLEECLPSLQSVVLVHFFLGYCHVWALSVTAGASGRTLPTPSFVRTLLLCAMHVCDFQMASVGFLFQRLSFKISWV